MPPAPAVLVLLLAKGAPSEAVVWKEVVEVDMAAAAEAAEAGAAAAEPDRPVQWGSARTRRTGRRRSRRGGKRWKGRIVRVVADIARVCLRPSREGGWRARVRASLTPSRPSPTNPAADDTSPVDRGLQSQDVNHLPVSLIGLHRMFSK